MRTNRLTVLALLVLLVVLPTGCNLLSVPPAPLVPDAIHAGESIVVTDEMGGIAEAVHPASLHIKYYDAAGNVVLKWDSGEVDTWKWKILVDPESAGRKVEFRVKNNCPFTDWASSSSEPTERTVQPALPNTPQPTPPVVIPKKPKVKKGA